MPYGGTAPDVAATANRLNNQWFVIVSMVVLDSLSTTVSAFHSTGALKQSLITGFCHSFMGQRLLSVSHSGINWLHDLRHFFAKWFGSLTAVLAVQTEQRLAQRVARVSGFSGLQFADGCLAAAALIGNFRLSKPACQLDFFNDCLPHARHDNAKPFIVQRFIDSKIA